MTPDELVRELAPLNPPPNLVALCEHEMAGGYPPGIELLVGARERLDAASGGDPRWAEHLWPFARDRSDGLYAFWTLASRDLTRAPVVYLCSEGVNNVVMAESFDRFLVALCDGFRLPGHRAGKLDDNDTSLVAFRRWVDEQLMLQIDGSAEEIAEQARRLHPDFDTWLFPELPIDGAASDVDPR